LSFLVAMDGLPFMEKFSTAELELTGVQPAWGSRIVCPDLGLRPRQFEYDPKVKELQRVICT
jgi:hypothetical protein